ncbi:Abi family protein [Ferruginibacter sp. HRS2-29]|uniref:Abi family protein n=1 Tax=Ferruginibacter sp. HRS2-29 TaxID=2487334 RepID=UPI0020CBEF6C|nr:Abi family protein [Ferruginibacter sp. HRS2-29]MCP9752924.1 Abi family protein [Ferruginibacter sp. HRS2-29]
MKYTKTPETPEQCCEILKNRGLIINDPDRAIKYLTNVGYFRLTGYMFHLQSNDGKHTFIDGTKFDDIIALYQFDKKLRGIISEYLERIEICLRAKLTDKYSITNGFFWYNDRELFEDAEIFDTINREIKDTFDDPKELFLKRFKSKYVDEDMPPSSMALEILSLGKLARLYKALKNKNGKSEIATEFNLPSSTITSWYIYLANVRNICAHHSRLWNKKVTADRPQFPTREKYKFKGENFEDSNTTLYGIISMIDRLLISFNPKNTFTSKIENLIREYSINCLLMGFPEDWEKTANWRCR